MIKKEISYEEWIAEGKRRFGDDFMAWRFVCPMCKHVATVEDFKAYKTAGAQPDDATQMCIGRYLPKDKRYGLSRDHANPKVKQPCDYAGFGLFRLSPNMVNFPDGSKSYCFDFAD